MHELISIIIPVYNVIDEIDRCVESALKQTFKNIQIILVDDGSNDGSGVRCDYYRSIDNRVTVVHQPNSGLSSARNAGLRIASGRYVMYLDSDDYIELDACDVFAKAIERYHSDIITADWDETPPDHKDHYSKLRKNASYSSRDYVVQAIKAKQWYPCSVFSLYRREFLIENDLWFKQGILHEDMELLPKIYLAAKSVALIDYVFYHYVKRDGSITSPENEANKQHILSLKTIYTEWYSLFSSISDKLLRERLLGYLAKYYLYDCRVRNQISGFEIPGINKRFLLSHSLDMFEFVKACVFCVSRKTFCRLK